MVKKGTPGILKVTGLKVVVADGLFGEGILVDLLSSYHASNLRTRLRGKTRV